MGCGGGLMDNGFKYAKENAMCTEESYPYTAKNGKCTASSCSAGIPEGSVTGYRRCDRRRAGAHGGGEQGPSEHRHRGRPPGLPVLPRRRVEEGLRYAARPRRSPRRVRREGRRQVLEGEQGPSEH